MKKLLFQQKMIQQTIMVIKGRVVIDFKKIQRNWKKNSQKLFEIELKNMKKGKQTVKQCRKNQILIWKWNLINSNPMDNYLSCLIKKYMYLTLFKNPYLE